MLVGLRAEDVSASYLHLTHAYQGPYADLYPVDVHPSVAQTTPGLTGPVDHYSFSCYLLRDKTFTKSRRY